MSSETNFSITKKTEEEIPADVIPFREIKEEVLGESYELSLVFVTDELSKELNEEYRDKEGPTNILSFPLSDEAGEIFINIDAVNREHDEFDRDPDHFTGYLFIHGLLHLKGMEHGSKMEEEERQIREQFNV